MKIDLKKWEKTKKRTLFFLWPSCISTFLIVFVMPLADRISSDLTMLTFLISLLVYVPFAVADVRRYKAEAAQEKRELQEKYDAQDKAMFGKPLREIEL